ncbi:MAG: hypothetical protein U0168_24280 [Nannocystaceae bacterium]
MRYATGAWAVLVLVVGCGKDVGTDPFQMTTAEGSGTGTSEGTDAGTTTHEPTVTEGSSSSAATMATTTEADTSSSAGTTGEASVCGDGVISGDEVCDGELFGDATCVTQGYYAGTLTCNPTCLGFDTSGCYICGNGVIEQAEDCDGPLPDDIDCVDAGFTEGPVSCNMRTCLFDTSECSLCGDGVASGNELCDTDDLAGASCESLGFDAGTLACGANTCGFDYSGCSGGQYIQDFELGSIPPELALSGNADWSAQQTVVLAGAWSAASGNIDDGETSTMTLSVTFAVAGTVAFTHQESSEDGYDYLEFSIDGVLQDEWSGILAASDASYPVAAGDHTLQWSYTKDGSLEEGDDAVYVDDIVLTGGVPTG